MAESGATEQVAGPEGRASPAAERLLESLSGLRMRLEAVAPDDPVRWRDAAELLRQAEQRLRALDHMLAWAREREATMTVRLASGEMRLAELDSRIGDLTETARKLSDAEGARLAAETAAAEAEQRLATERAELESARSELRELRSRTRDLESDLATLAEQLATSTVDRARAERLERERDVAMAQARSEAQLAMEERLRAADAQRQLVFLEERLREERRRFEEAETLDLSDGRSSAGEEVVDLTDEPEGANGDEVRVSRPGPDEAVVWGQPPQREGFVGWLRRGFLGDTEDDEEFFENDR